MVLYSNSPPKSPRYFLILKKATRALNGRALPFCVQMVQNVDMSDHYIFAMYLLNLTYIVFYRFGSNVGTCIGFSIYFPRLFCFWIYVPYTRFVELVLVHET